MCQSTSVSVWNTKESTFQDKDKFLLDEKSILFTLTENWIDVTQFWLSVARNHNIMIDLLGTVIMFLYCNS